MKDQIARILPADLASQIIIFEKQAPLTLRMPFIKNLNEKFTAKTKIFTAGSCFADNIAQSLSQKGLMVGPYYNNKKFRESLGPNKDWVFCTLPENNPCTTSFTHTAFDPLQLRQDFKFALDLLSGKSLPELPIYQATNPFYTRLGYDVNYCTPLMAKVWAKESHVILKMLGQIYRAIAHSLTKSNVYVLTYGVAEYVQLSQTGLYACNTGPKKLQELGTAGILDVESATNAIEETLEIINQINKNAIIFISLSPVRLNQTTAAIDNLCNIYQMGFLGKSILRVAIENAIIKNNKTGPGNTYYIPSYEYVCLNAAYDSDHRNVSRSAVDEIIDCFTLSYFQ